MKNNKGFTLTELLAVIVIISILSVAAISGYSTMTRNSKKKTYESKVQSIENAAIKFANDSNLNTSTTITVNKLVVEGYLQPDESTETGLASILNPVNNENMICNLVRITVNDDLYIAEYNENKKDCLIAEQEMLDLEINIKAKELNGNTIGNNIAIINNVANWTRTDVLLIVSSEEYTDFNSISYDFDGRTITKEKNTPLSTATNYVETDYDKIAIKDVLIMFNNEVTVTYNMNDGTIHSKTVVVRIDKEVPTARAVASNDVSTSSTRKVSLTLDDANGSGVKGFYVSKSSDFTGKPLIKDTSDKDSKEAGHGSFAGYNSHFYGEQGEYYIKVIDKVGNEYITEKIELSNFDPNANSCRITVDPIVAPTPTYWTEDTEWYNKNIKVTTTSNNDIGSMGIKYFYDVVNVGTNITNEKKLTKFFRPEGLNTKLIKSLNQTNESDLRDYYTAMKGLSNKTKDITHCKKTIGVDKTKPTATITCTDSNTYKKTHTINISIKDELSGFSDNSIKIGWSPDRTTPPTSWLDLNGSISADKKSVSFTTDANKTTGDPLTGEYYLWIQGDSIADKAYNYLNNTSTTYVIKYDNTPPTCTNSGGSNTWKKVDITIKGACKDDHSGCKPGTNNGATTYDTAGNVYKLYNKDIESTNESPGRIYDKAGNHKDCEKDQVVKRDTVSPNNPSLVMTHSYNGNESEGKKATVYTNDTWVNANIKTAVYMTDARYAKFRGPSATDSGTVKSGINRYQISSDKKNWSNYSYVYSGSDSLYTLLSDGTHNRYIRAIDNAGNISNVVTYTIKIDKTPPTTPSLVMTHSYNKDNAEGRKATVYTNDTWVNANISTAVYMTDARYAKFKGPSAEDATSKIKKYQISANNSNWYDYNYNYQDGTYFISTDGTHSRYIRAIDNAGNISSVRTLTIKIDKTAPSCTPIIRNSSNQKLKYGSIQHVTVTTYAGCSDSTSKCPSSEVKGKTYDPNVIGSNLATKETNYIKKDTIQIKDNAGNKRNCSVEAYTTPLCQNHTFIYSGNKDPYGEYWCTLSFSEGGDVSNSTLHTSFCLGFNNPAFESTYGTPKYFAICEGGDDAKQCKASCNSDNTNCPDKGTLVAAFQYLIDNDLSNQSQWTQKNPTNYMQRFEKIHVSGKKPNEWPDYPFTGRMMSKKGSVYNICDIDYGANGYTVYQRFA